MDECIHEYQISVTWESPVHTDPKEELRWDKWGSNTDNYGDIE